MNGYKKDKPASSAKPWQSVEGGTVKVTKMECWDGLLGCNQYKDFSAFKWHTLICDDCALGYSNRFGISRSHFGVLSFLIWQDESLSKSAKVLGGDIDKIFALGKGQEFRLKEHFKIIEKFFANRIEIEKANMIYRQLFYKESGVAPENIPLLHGIQSVE